jgi:hypothetical protein
MFAMIDIPVFLIGFGLGGWLAWKDKAELLSWYQGGEAFAKKLEAQAVTLQAKAAAVRAAIGPSPIPPAA